MSVLDETFISVNCRLKHVANVNVKLPLCLITKTGVMVKLHTFLTSALDEAKCLGSRSSRYTAEEEMPVCIRSQNRS